MLEMLAKAWLAMGIAWVLTTLIDPVTALGVGQGQIVVVFGFYLYCLIVLAVPSANKPFHVLSIPFLTQFLHLFQKYDFAAGANSLWRLFPFIVMDWYLLCVLVRFRTGLSRPEQTLLASWMIVQFLFIIISPNLEGVITGAFALFLISLPAGFLYFSLLSRTADFTYRLELYCSLLFIILALGTFGLVFFGVRYKGAENLLVTRNISDTNVTMAYFILLWPFAVRYASRMKFPLLATSLLVMLFVGVVVLSFSRGAVLIVGPYVAATLLIMGRFRHLLWFATSGIALYLGSDHLIRLLDVDLAYSWQLRFADFPLTKPGMDGLQAISGRAEIRKLAYALFLESPLYGHGIASFEVLGPGYREAHSMFFTMLAEQGLIGTLYLYAVLLALGRQLLQMARVGTEYWPFLLAFGAYLLFNHAVGTVFVIIPSKSLTVNCIAPLLLICLYYYSKRLCQKLGSDG